MSARRQPRLMPWRDPLPTPGPVMVFDIDGVVATMKKWEHLLGDKFSLEGWAEFQKHYGHAAPIARGARLVDDAIDAGLQIVWSTTRPDTAAAATWQWLQQNRLPLGPIMTRHRIKDGTRPAVEVKLRQWYWWLDKYGDVNPIAAWVDDENSALSALRWNGCPAWHPMHLQRTLMRNKDEPMMVTLMNRVTPSADKLAENLSAHRPTWDLRDNAFQQKRAKWWVEEQARMKVAREAQRRRQAAGRAEADRRRRGR